jgi:hypothetical protein
VPVMSTKEMLAAVGYSQPTNYAGRGGPNGLYATGPVTGGRGVTRATKAAKAKYPGLFGSNRYKRG